MIEIAQLGKAHTKGKSELENLLHKAQIRRMEHVRLICFKIENDVVKYTGIETVEYDEDHVHRYLYRRGGGNALNFSPTSIYIGRKTIEKKVLRWFTVHNIEPISTYIKTQEDLLDTICKDLEKSDLKSSIISVKINGKYLGNLSEYKGIFIENATKKFSEKYGVISSDFGECFICGKQKTVFGFTNPFSWMTVNHACYAYNLEREKTVQQFPVCVKCALDFACGKELLDTLFKINFYGGIQCYLIPNFVFEEQKHYRKVIQIMENIEGKRYNDKILPLENMWKRSQMLENQLLLSFVFFEKSKDQITVWEEIRDVSPTWISTIHSVLEEVLNEEIYSEDELRIIFGENSVGSFKEKIIEKLKGHDIFTLINYFTETKKEFVEYAKYILQKQKISEESLSRMFVRKYQTFFRKGFRLTFPVILAEIIAKTLVKIGVM